MFSAAKDAMASNAAKAYINGRISRYGELQDLRIESGNKRMQATCLLHGESSPITVHVDRYEITESGGQRFIRVRACRCARPWLQNALEDFVVDRPIELPSWAASAL
jgi:hypothetical protein